MDKILTILGPTATGKTDLALLLAKKLQGELISADSRQVYVGLDLGTGKMPAGLGVMNHELSIKKHKKYWEMDGIRVWMYDVLSPKKQYTVADFVKDANRIIKKIRDRGKLPILVGGTGLYIKALIDGFSNLAIPLDKKLRQELAGLPLNQLQKKLKKISFDKWKNLNNSDKQNPRRLIRAIELEDNKGVNMKGVWEVEGLTKQFNILKIGLTAPRKILYKKSDQRLVKRINQGMIAEAKKLQTEGLSIERMRQLGLEYGILADFLEGKIKSKEKLIETLQSKIHGYIGRQITWFKKERDVLWSDITDKDFLSEVENTVSKWYYPT